MTAAKKLERYYPGDDAWADFLEAAPRRLEGFGEREKLVALLGGDEALANAVFALTGSQVFEWISTPKAMLDGVKPLDCLFEHDLRWRFRTMLMRM